MTGPHDTIYAHSSGSPPAAIAVIRISGPRAKTAGAWLCGSLPAARLARVRTIRSPTGEPLDEALVLSFDGPASATGEDLVELHCHGSRAVIAAVLVALGSTEGLREALPGEFTRRAFENGRIDLTEAEGLADLLEAETESQRRAALSLAGGAVRRQVEEWRGRLVALSARAEAAIDYADDEDETAADARALAQAAGEIRLELEAWLARPRAELLKRGIRVVLAGPPNSGKSSLLNRLAGVDRALVSPEAGTTRDLIEVPLAIDGVPFLFVDTAGLREASSEVEQAGVRLAEKQLAAADLLLWLGTPADAPVHPRRILVHSQVDRPERAEVPDSSLGVSAVTDAGVRELVAELIRLAKALLPSASEVPLNARQWNSLNDAQEALSLVTPSDIVLTAEALRQARTHFERVTGRAGMEDVLDALFGRFCLGK